MKSLIEIAQDKTKILSKEEVEKVSGAILNDSIAPGDCTLGCRDTPTDTGSGGDKCDWTCVD